MYLQRFLMTSGIAATGLFISACATGPDAQMASGSYQCGQLDVSIASAGDGDLLGVDYQGKRLLLKPKSWCLTALMMQESLRRLRLKQPSLTAMAASSVVSWVGRS